MRYPDLIKLMYHLLRLYMIYPDLVKHECSAFIPIPSDPPMLGSARSPNQWHAKVRES